MKTEHVLCLSISIEINAALEISKKMQCFRLEIKSFVVAGKKINDVGVFPSLPYVHKLTLNNAET